MLSAGYNESETDAYFNAIDVTASGVTMDSFMCRTWNRNHTSPVVVAATSPMTTVFITIGKYFNTCSDDEFKDCTRP